MLKNLIAKLKCNRGEADGSAEKSGADESGQSGEKLEGLVQDIDFSSIPEDKREDVIKLVTEKVKLYDAGFRTKSEDLAIKTKELETRAEGLRDIEKLQEEIKGNPGMEKVVTKTINDFRAGKTTPKQTDKSLKKLDQLIDTAEDAAQREQLITMREIIKQEAGSGAYSEEFKSLKEEIAQLRQATSAGLSGGIKSSMQTLKDSFGEEIVGKYESQIKDMLQKYPTYLDNPEKVLFNLAKTDEIFEAHGKIKAKQIEVENKRRAAGSFPGGDSKPSEIEKPRDKAGRVDTKKYIEKLEAAGRFK